MALLPPNFGGALVQIFSRLHIRKHKQDSGTLHPKTVEDNDTDNSLTYHSRTTSDLSSLTSSSTREASSMRRKTTGLSVTSHTSSSVSGSSMRSRWLSLGRSHSKDPEIRRQRREAKAEAKAEKKRRDRELEMEMRRELYMFNPYPFVA